MDIYHTTQRIYTTLHNGYIPHYTTDIYHTTHPDGFDVQLLTHQQYVLRLEISVDHILRV
jgi:hypothetical protein